MKTYDFFVDMHCHPCMKPVGKSFRKPSTTWVNAPNRRRQNSLWHFNPPSVADKLLSYVTKLARFSQSDLSSMGYGHVQIACVSLYPIEKWFFRNKINNDVIADLIANFATGIGDKRIDYIQDIDNYFEDLEKQYDFYHQLNNRTILLEDGQYCYRLTRNWSDVFNNIRETGSNKQTVISIIFSIEGLHVLNTGLKKPANEREVLDNVLKIKSWVHRPFFVTPAHHFWNELCGHAKSLSGFADEHTDQAPGINTGWTPLGRKVLRLLLDASPAKRRILIDLKHMSLQSRMEYYRILSEEYSGQDIPLIVSHGACNGMVSPDQRVVQMQHTGHDLHHSDINFYDNEIVRIAQSNGLFCVQLDENKLAGSAAKNKLQNATRREKIMHHSAGLVWRQVQHIAEILDRNGLFAWGTTAIGSDFDGIINPLKGFWTAREMPFLADYLERHAYNFMDTPGEQLQHAFNRIEPNEIINRIMRNNALELLERHYV